MIYFGALAGQFTDVLTHSIDLSPNGWTDNVLTAEWFEKVFVPTALAAQADTSKPVVLTVDGHESHETDLIKDIAYKHDIVIVGLPSKTTHKLQPLDVAVFGPVQDAWYKCVSDQLDKGIKITWYNVVHEYMEARKVITPPLIQTAFRKTGLHPFDPDVFQDEDFVPSMASSSIVHVPSVEGVKLKWL